MNFSEIINQIILKKDLHEENAHECMREILSGNVPSTQIAAFLAALRAKGESVGEITGFVKAMRASMVKISCSDSVIADTCGTGGDGKSTFNISTASAFVLAATGIKVAKHGNRSVSSRCGSADLLEAAGVKIDMSKDAAEKCLNEIGITFLLAPLYHPAMKNVAGVRKELGIRTVFNILGPLCNPASANVQVIGVPTQELVPKISEVLKKLNRNVDACASVVHEAGYDELVLQEKSVVSEIYENKIKLYSLSPENLNLKKTKTQSLKGGDAKENAQVLRDVLSQEDHSLHDVVTANAALSLFCAKKLKGEKMTLKEAVQKAKQVILDGSALKKLEQLIEWSH